MKRKFIENFKHKNRTNNSQRGVAAVEFAFIAPVMILMLFGASEASQAVTIDRKVSIAASTIADLVAQNAAIDCAGLAASVAVTREVFAPNAADGAAAQITVASIALDSGVAKVEWSRVVNADLSCSNASNYVVGDSVSIPGGTANQLEDMIPTNGALIVGDVKLNYNSLGTTFFPNSIVMNERFFLRPRNSDKVCFDGIATDGC